MLLPKHLASVACFLLLAGCAPSQLPVNTTKSSCEELTAAIDKTYGFKPSKLSREEIDAKSAELDKVWTMVERDQERMLPCLRTEYSKRSEDTFFRFNAANLIGKFDKSRESKTLSIEAYAQADLADINLAYWLPFMAGLGREGFDVTKPGETWLRFKSPEYYLPQHGTRPVDKSVGALALFGSMDESIATPALAKLASQDSDFRSIVISLLVAQSTAESDAEAIKLGKLLPEPLASTIAKNVNGPKKIVPREGPPKTSREKFISALSEFLEGRPDSWVSLTVENSDGEKDMVVVLGPEDLPLIRKVRRAYASMATPHTPEWYESFTQVINTIRLRAAEKKAN